MDAGRFKTYLNLVDHGLGGGIKKNNVTIISGHEKSARTRADLCHRLCVVNQITENSNGGKKEALYLDFSRACTIRPDKFLLTAKSFPLHWSNVLKNVNYGRIGEGQILLEQNSLVRKVTEVLGNNERFGLIIMNDLPVAENDPNFSPSILYDLARDANISIIVNKIDDGVPEANHEAMKSVHIETFKVGAGEGEAAYVRDSKHHFSLDVDAQLKFPTKGMTASTIVKNLEKISLSNRSNTAFWSAFDLWRLVTDMGKKKISGQKGKLIEACTHFFLCAMSFTLEQLKEFKWQKNRSLSIAGLVVATVGAAFWLWEIYRKWSSRERHWFMWPFFPATVGLIVEVNQVAFYIGCLIHPGKPPRILFSAVLFHLSCIIKLVAKGRRENLKSMRLGSEGRV